LFSSPECKSDPAKPHEPLQNLGRGFEKLNFALSCNLYEDELTAIMLLQATAPRTATLMDRFVTDLAPFSGRILLFQDILEKT
jgi:SUMO ligase MMS21 Smc5/6 complex component